MSKTKKITGYIKLTIIANKANPSPPIGPALGQRGVNIMEFCKDFNARTQSMEPGMPVPVVITVFEDKTFSYITKTPPASYLLKKVAKIEKGSAATNKEPNIGKVTIDDCKNIAQIKLEDLNAYDIDQGAKIIRGTAKSMGIEVVEG